MASTKAAIRYARAILDIAISKNSADKVQLDMLSISETISKNLELSTFIQNPTSTVETKQNALLEIFSNSDSITKDLFRLLHDNKRFEILDVITYEYIKLYDELKNIEVAFVTTAFKMDEALETKVLSKIGTFSSKKITIINNIDPTIIGGFILRIGDLQYNASVANKLQVLKRELAN